MAIVQSTGSATDPTKSLREILAVVERLYEILVEMADRGLVDWHYFEDLPDALRLLRELVREERSA